MYLCVCLGLVCGIHTRHSTEKVQWLAASVLRCGCCFTKSPCRVWTQCFRCMVLRYKEDPLIRLETCYRSFLFREEEEVAKGKVESKQGSRKCVFRPSSCRFPQTVSELHTLCNPLHLKPPHKQRGNRPFPFTSKGEIVGKDQILELKLVEANFLTKHAKKLWVVGWCLASFGFRMQHANQQLLQRPLTAVCNSST